MKRIGRRLVLALALSAAACTAASPYMRPTTYTPAPARADKAYVVFIRPTDFGSAVRFEIFDGEGRYLGDALPESYFEAELDPGQHWFYADAENAGVMSAQLAGGKRYYVAVLPRMGSWSARVELMALTPRSKDWPNVQRWLAELDALEVDRQAGQAALDARRAAIEAVIAEGQEVWAATAIDWREQRSLMADDGEGSAVAEPSPEPATEEPAVTQHADEPSPSAQDAAVPDQPADEPVPTP